MVPTRNLRSVFVLFSFDLFFLAILLLLREFFDLVGFLLFCFGFYGSFLKTSGIVFTELTFTVKN